MKQGKTPIFYFCVTGVILSLLGPIVNDLASVIASCLLLATYTAWAAHAAKSRARPGALLSTAANHVFLLGHLYTLSGLLGAAAQLGSDSRRMLLTVAALKLATSVMGLIGMFYLKRGLEEDDSAPVVNRTPDASLDHLVLGATPSEREQWENARKVIFARTDDVATELGRFQQSVAHFGKALTSASEHVAQLQSRTAAAGTTFLVLEESTRKSAKRLDDATDQMKTFSSGFGELERVLDDFSQVIENRIDLAQQ